MELVKSDSQSDLDYFIEFLFGGLQGYAYLVMKEPGKDGKWNASMYQYPEQAHVLKHYIKVGFDKYEVYLAPALYSTDENAQRENVKASNVVWTEFDGNSPSDWGDYPPSLVIQSSTEDHTHAYWRLATPLYGADEIENYTHRISYNLQADSSAWDATQVLRPPGTFNHKRSLPTFIRTFTEDSFDPSIFDSLAPPPVGGITDWEVGALPDVPTVLLKYAFTTELQKLLGTETVPEGQRSSKMMQFAYAACELGLKDVEVFVLLKLLDDRWGKFVGRTDRDKRLAGIVTFARNKYPVSDGDSDGNLILAFGYQSFLDAEFEVDWVIDPMLMDRGSLLLVGESGIGKTQFYLELMTNVALGRNFLDYTISKPRKVLFLSLEMGMELRVFLEAQAKVLSEADYAVLEENLIIIPHGESWALNQPLGQQALCQFIEEFEVDGVFVDSIGSAIIGNINSQEVVQSYNNFVDHVRKKYNIFWGAIHHTRKKAAGQIGSSQDDVYGDQYLVARASSVYALQRGRDGVIKLDNWKMRLAEKQDRQYLLRDGNTLTFSKTTEGVADGKVIISSEPGETSGPFKL